MFSLIPDGDDKQTLRVRRFLYLAVTSYLLWVGIAVLCYVLGLSRATPTMILIICVLIIINNLIFYVLIRTGISKKFKDPSLTVYQMISAIIWTGVASYIALSPLRGNMLALFLVVFVFGLFRLSLKGFLALVGVSVFTYATAILTLYNKHPEDVNVSLEFIRGLLLLATLMWFSLVGNYIQNLRKKVSRANSKLQEALKIIERQAIHDELTDIYNRRQMFTILRREKALADRTTIPFALCLLDLDDFKEINDTYGHLVGDNVLKIFAQTIQGHIRKEDYIARYGGDEFLVIFTGRHCVDNSRECAARLQTITRRMDFTDTVAPIKISASFGVSVYQSPESIDTLLTRVDAAMYEAKKNGKNKIIQVLPEKKDASMER